MDNRLKSKSSSEKFEVTTEELEAIIKEGNVEKLNICAKNLGERFSKNLKSTQIRKFLSEVQKIKEFEKDGREKLHLLRPLLAYLAGRHRGGVKEFQEIIEKAIPLITNNKEFNYFKHFIEAIVAYHRYYGGKE